MSEVQEEYNRLIRQPAEKVRGRAGVWRVSGEGLNLDPAQLAEWGDAFPGLRPVRRHKHRPDRSAARYDIGGRAVFVKSWEYSGLTSRLKQALRPGKGRAAWAKGQALHRCGFTCPAPLGGLELYSSAGLPIRSLYLCDYWEDALNARHWLRRDWLDFTPEDLVRVGDLLLDLWSSLRHQQVYHADFKLYNLLVPPDGSFWEKGFGLIDIDAIRIGGAYTRRDIERNLVQLNGSLGGWIPPDTRLDWLKRFAAEEPWVQDPGVIDALTRETNERLQRELRRIDGP